MRLEPHQECSNAVMSYLLEGGRGLGFEDWTTSPAVMPALQTWWPQDTISERDSGVLGLKDFQPRHFSGIYTVFPRHLFLRFLQPPTTLSPPGTPNSTLVIMGFTDLLTDAGLAGESFLATAQLELLTPVTSAQQLAAHPLLYHWVCVSLASLLFFYALE